MQQLFSQQIIQTPIMAYIHILVHAYKNHSNKHKQSWLRLDGFTVEQTCNMQVLQKDYSQSEVEGVGRHWVKSTVHEQSFKRIVWPKQY